MHPHQTDGALAPGDLPTPARPPLPAGFPGGLGDRAGDLVLRARADWRVGAAVLALVAALAGYLWYRAGAPAAPPAPATAVAGPTDGADPAATDPAATDPGPPSSPPASGSAVGAGTGVPSTAAPPMVVHVAGAVVAPGVYGLAPGARVSDAVAAAGGPSPDAALDVINLATPLADGQRVEVPRHGDPAGAGGVTGGPAPPPGGGGGAAPSPTEPLDLNRATAAELDALPGVGPSIAAAIVAQRESSGGFDAVEDLLEVRGIGEARLAELQPLVTV